MKNDTTKNKQEDNHNIQEINSKTNKLFIEWIYFYLVVPETIDFMNNIYTIPNNNIQYIYQQLLYYPLLNNNDEIDINTLNDYDISINTYEDIHLLSRDDLLKIYKTNKKNTEFFNQLKTINKNNNTNKIYKISKEQKNNTYYYLVPFQQKENYYLVGVIYINNTKIPNILSSNKNSYKDIYKKNYLSNIKIINNKFNLFNSIDKKFYENKNDNYKDHLNILKTKLANITIKLIYKYLSIYLPELDVKQNEKNISKLNWRSHLNLNLTNFQHHSQTD